MLFSFGLYYIKLNLRGRANTVIFLCIVKLVNNTFILVFPNTKKHTNELKIVRC